MPSNPFTSETEIHRIGNGLLDLSLAKREWTHTAHFAAALWLMRYRPEIDLRACMPGFIKAYNEATGVENSDSGGYHETITQASLRAARAFLAGHAASASVYAVVNALMESRLGDRGWLLTHWSKDLLFSVEARRRWIEPDLEPLPF